MLASTWGVRASGSLWQRQHKEVAGSDTEPIVPGHPTPPPALSHMAGTQGCTGTAAPSTTSLCWHPLMPPGSRHWGPPPWGQPRHRVVCATSWLAREEQPELHPCHPRAIPVPIASGCPSPRTGSAVRSVLQPLGLELSQHQAQDRALAGKNWVTPCPQGLAPVPHPRSRDPDPARHWGKAAAGEPH